MTGMSPAQTTLRDLLSTQSEQRGRLAELAAISEQTDETRGELKTLQAGTPDLELRLRAARLAVEGEGATENRNEPDSEMRERIALRRKASLGKYLLAASRGHLPGGAEAELRAAAKVDGIPFELWDVPAEEEEKRAISPAPSNAGVNVHPYQPAVFAPSVAAKLGIAMPQVGSGTFSTGTISQSVTADAVAKSGAVPETAAAFTTQTTTPHRIGSALRLTAEDVATVGQGNFESILRQNVSMVLSDHLDENMLNGGGSSNELNGIFQRLTDGSAPAAGVESWTRFLAVQSGGIDGLWATELSQVMMLVGVESYRLAAATFQGTDSEESAASYMKRMGAGFTTNKRMPAKVSHIQQAILCRKGRSMQLAVCPVWHGSIAIDDIYSGAGTGERVFTLSTLVGDVLIQQPDAYAQISFRVSV